MPSVMIEISIYCLRKKLQLNIGEVSDSAPKLLLSLAFERGKGDYRRTLADKRIARDLFDASGTIRFVKLVDLGDDDDVGDIRAIHIIDHHSVVTGDASPAVNKLDYAADEIDILIFGEITVGKR